MQAELIGRAIIRVQQSLDGSSQQMLLAGLELVCKQMRVLGKPRSRLRYGPGTGPFWIIWI